MYFKEKLEKMKEIGILVKNLLQELSQIAKPGIKTIELELYAREYVKKNNCNAPCFNYQSSFAKTPYPSYICTSVNYVICHGIPNDYILKNGDILSIDIVLEKNGFNADSCITVPIGECSLENLNLIKITKEAMFVGINSIKINGFIEQIGENIQNFIENHNKINKTNYSIVREYGGHGIGESIHEEPFVPNVKSLKKENKIIPGMFFTIEPMINLGTYQTRVLKDNWSVITKDYKNSAHFEHTIAVTENGFEIIT